MRPLTRLRWVGWAAPVFVVSAVLFASDAHAQVPQPGQGRPAFSAPPPLPVERGWIGVGVDLSVVEPFGGPASLVARVVRTVDGGPAAEVGIVPGDVIRAIDGEPLTVEGWQDFTRSLRPGVELRLAVERGGRSRDVRLITSPRPSLPPAPVGLTDHLDSVRTSVRTQLESGRDLWASRDYVTLLLADDSDGQASTRILDLARRSSASNPLRREPTVDFVGPSSPNGYTVVWDTDGALPFEYLMLQSPEADSVKSAIVHLRGELSAVAEATRVREQEIGAIVELATRRLGDGDAQLLRLRSDNERVREDLERLALRLAEIGSNERGRRVGSRGDAPEVGVSSWPVTARVAGRSFIGGAQFNDLNPRLGTYFGTDRGVLVIQVLSGTPCDEAGLVAGDVVTHVGDTEIDSVEGLRAELDRVFARARRAELTLVRKGERMAATLSR